jgi:predicted DNA-binding WGR domain protein
MTMKVHLRFYHDTGGSKDWIIEVQQNGYARRWGKTNAILAGGGQRLFTASTNPTADALNLIGKQKAQGYTVVSSTQPLPASRSEAKPKRKKKPMKISGREKSSFEWF